jgi:SAM-dependent methyltransferase
MTTHPFDVLAPTYDEDFTHAPLAGYLRGRTRARLALHFRAGDQVIEFGCGTGEDAVWLAKRGISVLATDASAEMRAITSAKASDCPNVEVGACDLAHMDAFISERVFDGAFANFGALNCTHDWAGVAAWLAQHIQPQGVVCFGVMSPYCMMEMLWHSAHGDFKTAFRRVRGRAMFQPHASAAPMHIYYPTIAALTQAFAPHFMRVHVRPIGLLVPPSDVFPSVEKRPQLLKRLRALDSMLSKGHPLALFADHFWIEFRRV